MDVLKLRSCHYLFVAIYFCPPSCILALSQFDQYFDFELHDIWDVVHISDDALQTIKELAFQIGSIDI